MTSHALYPQFSLNDWSGVTPVILPFEPRTLSCIGIASAGVAVPFFLFLVAMFYLLVPIWLQNFHSDKYASSNDVNTNNSSENSSYNNNAQSQSERVGLMLVRQSEPRRVSAYPEDRGGNEMMVGDGKGSYFNSGQRVSGPNSYF
jgi:hypothetical protein